MVELVYTLSSEGSGLTAMRVQIPLPAPNTAEVVKLVNALALEVSDLGLAGSTPAFGTKHHVMCGR